MPKPSPCKRRAQLALEAQNGYLNGIEVVAALHESVNSLALPDKTTPVADIFRDPAVRMLVDRLAMMVDVYGMRQFYTRFDGILADLKKQAQ